jgi:hypothetical protein
MKVRSICGRGFGLNAVLRVHRGVSEMAPGGVKGGLFGNSQKLKAPSRPGELEDIHPNHQLIT